MRRTTGALSSAFSPFPHENIRLIKQDGQTIADIDAIVQSSMILITNVQLPIEEGDRLIRVLPNGLDETYVVMDRGYKPGIAGLEPHYQVKVRKESAIPSPSRATTTIYNVTGANSRLNINSVDQSVNLVDTSAEDLFATLRSTITSDVPDAEQQKSVLSHLDRLEQAVGTPSFLERYTNFIAAAANHMTLLAPFLPGLMQLVHRS